jgi:hypothetical protein
MEDPGQQSSLLGWLVSYFTVSLLSQSVSQLSHYVGPCHHSMACSQVADGGDGHQIWRVAVNIINK